MKDHPVRKMTRLKDFDYSTPGIYFITVCTSGRKNIFWADSQCELSSPSDISLSAIGMLVWNTISNIPNYYPSVTIEHFVVMPNHIHILLHLHPNDDLLSFNTPTVSRIVSHLKAHVSKQIGKSIWQKLFYDHIIRNENDFQTVWAYIENNPLKWTEDELFN